LSINEQSQDISQGVSESLEKRSNDNDEKSMIGAGDQGMMVGYACKETDELMPLPITLSHKLVQQLSHVRNSNELDYLRPDGKSQVTIEYSNGKPKRVDTVVISTQHNPEVEQATIREDIINKVINKIIPQHMVDDKTKYHVNPSGRFVIGGPTGDTGLTGRKILVDTYGGFARHGGGAFSGKDPTKVDRSGAYAARWVAKNIVAAGVADLCEVQLAYAIGMAEPVSISVETYGTAKFSYNQIIEIINKVFDLRPAAIIEQLNLRSPIYYPTSFYGHFGRLDLDLPWEKLNKVDDIKNLI
jgi:S-adenosylmethionine synthetase